MKKVLPGNRHSVRTKEKKLTTFFFLLQTRPEQRKRGDAYIFLFVEMRAKRGHVHLTSFLWFYFGFQSLRPADETAGEFRTFNFSVIFFVQCPHLCRYPARKTSFLLFSQWVSRGGAPCINIVLYPKPRKTPPPPLALVHCLNNIYLATIANPFGVGFTQGCIFFFFPIHLLQRLMASNWCR